jgi:hypothetical protein
MDLQSLYNELAQIERDLQDPLSDQHTLNQEWNRITDTIDRMEENMEAKTEDWIDTPLEAVYEDDDMTLVDLGDGQMITRAELDRANNWKDLVNCEGCVYCSGNESYDPTDEI